MDKNSILNATMMRHLFFVRVKQPEKLNGVLNYIDFVTPVLVNKDTNKFKNLETNEIFSILNENEQNALQQAVDDWYKNRYWFNREHLQVFDPIKNSVRFHQKNNLENTYLNQEPQILAIYHASDLQLEIYKASGNLECRHNLKFNLQRPTHLYTMQTVDMPLKDVLKLAKSSETIFNIKNRIEYKKRKQDKKEQHKVEAKKSKLDEDSLNF